MDFPYDPDPGSKTWAPVAGVVSDSHALSNDYSTSQTLPVAVMLELPSLQYPETDLSSRIMSPRTPPFDAMNAHIESPSTVSVQSNCVSPRNSGLLEALLHEAQAMGSAENRDKSSDSSTVMLGDLVETSPVSLCNTWGGYGEPVSPLGCSAASVFNACIPPISVSSLDESSSDKASNDLNVKLENVEPISHQNAEGMQTSQVDFSHQGVLLGADWCHNVSKVHNVVSDAIATLLDDLRSEVTCAIATACASGTSSSSIDQGFRARHP